MFKLDEGKRMRITEEVLKDAEEVNKHFLAGNETDYGVCNGSILLCALVVELAAKLREREWQPIDNCPEGVRVELYCADGFFSPEDKVEIGTRGNWPESATHYRLITPPKEESR